MTTKTPLDAQTLLAEANVVGALADGRDVLGVRTQRPWHTSMRQLKSVLLSAATDGMDPLFETAP